MGDQDELQLPPEMPADLRDFLQCKSASVTLKDGTLTWLKLEGLGDMMPDGLKPDLSISPGTTPGTGTITIKLVGDFQLSLPASISNGELSVDTSNPPWWAPQKLIDGINKGIKDLNDLLKKNGKGFGPPKFGSGKVTLSKIDLAPGPGKTTPPPQPPKPPPPPPPPPAAPPATGWGCFGLLFLGLAIVGVGAILFFGGPALGLFGAAETPTGAATATGTPTPPSTVVASPTASPTPASRTVTSDDGSAFLFIPHDSAPADAPITLTARGQADAPSELEGVTFRSSFYRIGPTDLTFTGEVGFGRLVDLTAQGLDPDEVGYSVTSHALRTYDGVWSWLGRQRSLIGGTAGTSPETQVQQQGSLMQVGEIFGIGGTVWAHRDPYPEQVEFGLGVTVRFGVQLTGPEGTPFVSGRDAAITRAVKYLSLAGIAEAGEPVVGFGSDGSPRVDVTATCRQVGELVVGVDLTVRQMGSSSLLDSLGLGTPPDHDISFRTMMHCVDQPIGFQPVLEAGCVSVVHEALSAEYPSYLHWLFGFRADPAFPSNATLDLSYREGSSGPVLTFAEIPIVDGKATADTGITSFGEKLFVDGHVEWSDGAALKSTLLTAADFEEVFGMSFTVTSAEEILAGNACR